MGGLGVLPCNQWPHLRGMDRKCQWHSSHVNIAAGCSSFIRHHCQYSIAHFAPLLSSPPAGRRCVFQYGKCRWPHSSA